MRPLLSKRGLFINTCATRPAGSEVRFEFTLADGSVTYAGEGVVRKEVPFVGGTSSLKSGMLVSLKRVNKAFKAVVDAILGETEGRSAQPHAMGRQFIVESRAGEHQGFDLFGDIDLDEGLDTLFSGIAKKPAKNEPSGIYEPPTVVSGMFKAPENEIMLEYGAGDAIGAPATPVSQLGNRLGERVVGGRLQEQSRAVTGQYAAVADNIANAEREAAQSKQFGALKSQGATTAEYDDAPTVNEMQAAFEARGVGNFDASADGGEGNMFGDALDFGNSPVAERMERDFEFTKRNADRDETPVQMERVSAQSAGMQTDESIARTQDENGASIDAQNVAPSRAEAEAFAQSAAESFDYAQSAAESFDYGQSAAESFDYAQSAAESFDYAQSVAESFDYAQSAAESFDYGQPAAESFDYGQSAAESFDYGQPAAESFDYGQPAAESFDYGQPVADSFDYSQSAGSDAAQAVAQSEGALAQETEFYSESERQYVQNSDLNQNDEANTAIEHSPAGAADEPQPFFQVSGGAQETPSELFEALQADILGEPSVEMPSVEAAMIAAQSPLPEAPADDAATVAMEQPNFSDIVHKGPIPIKLASQSEVREEKAEKKPDISLDELISKPVPRRASHAQPQSTGDLINTDLSKVSRPVPRKRESVQEEAPTPKKGGFFSNLFKR